MTVFELVAKLTLDSSEYEKDLKNQSESGGKLAGAWGKIGGAVKVGAAAIGAASVAVGALTKKSISAYAEYEQLWGGVQKLYGTAGKSLEEYASDVGKSVDEVRGEYSKLQEAQDLMLKQANEAYKTSGMSANQYMEQATQFSAALINSLEGDTSAAAKQTDVAMRAISDNFNTFGGDIQNVQNAFSGFARGQFNMLDNLKLGYSGSRAGMQDLIEDANKYAESIGMAGDLSIDSFSDIVTAIDLVQQKQGIAGTTANEAATTIEGSLNMTKAAWENLITSLANPDADIGQLIDNLVVAIVGDKEGRGLLNQIIPAVQRAVEGIGTFLTAAIPVLASKLPGLIQTFLPVAVDAIVSLVTSIASALPDIITTIADMMPQLIETVVNGLITAIGKAVPRLIKAAPQIVKAIATGLLKGAGVLLSAGGRLISSLTNAISSKLSAAGQKALALAKQIPQKIKSGLGSLVSAGSALIEGLWGGIKAKFDGVVGRVRALASKLPAAVKKVLGIASPSKVFMEIGRWIPEGLALGIERNLGAVNSAMDAMSDATTFTPAIGSVDGYGSTNGDVFNFNLNYDADTDATDMIRDLARGVQRYRMAGAI